jgi:putative transposase
MFFKPETLIKNGLKIGGAYSVGQSIRGFDVVRIMEEIKTEHRIIPERIQVDNGSEFISKDFDRWAYENKVILDYSRPGKPNPLCGCTSIPRI